MGATRRMEQFNPALEYQGLFIISGIGTAIIGLGVLLQSSATWYSIWKRKELAAGDDRGTAARLSGPFHRQRQSIICSAAGCYGARCLLGG